MIIDPNEYINESREWFLKKYLAPSIDTTRIIIIFLCLVINVNILLAILNITTTTTVMRFPIYVENIDESNHFIKNLSDPKQSIDEVFARYMLIRYINLRESYSANLLEPPTWRQTLLNIGSMSSNKTFDDFLNEVLPNKNPNSTIIKYRFSTSIIPIIKSIIITKFSGKKPVAAEVDLELLECNQKYNSCLSRNFNIDIDFEINSYPRFRFRIQDYRRSPIIKTSS